MFVLFAYLLYRVHFFAVSESKDSNDQILRIILLVYAVMPLFSVLGFLVGVMYYFHDRCTERARRERERQNQTQNQKSGEQGNQDAAHTQMNINTDAVLRRPAPATQRSSFGTKWRNGVSLQKWMRGGDVAYPDTVVLWDAEEFELETGRWRWNFERVSQRTMMGGRRWEDDGFVDVDLGNASIGVNI